jgi:hypothetical protein
MIPEQPDLVITASGDAFCIILALLYPPVHGTLRAAFIDRVPAPAMVPRSPRYPSSETTAPTASGALHIGQGGIHEEKCHAVAVPAVCIDHDSFAVIRRDMVREHGG